MKQHLIPKSLEPNVDPASWCLGLLLTGHVTACLFHPHTRVPRLWPPYLLGERDFRMNDVEIFIPTEVSKYKNKPVPSSDTVERFFQSQQFFFL